MSFSNYSITIGSVTYFQNQMEISTDGNLCMVFAYTDSTHFYILYTTNFKDATPIWNVVTDSDKINSTDVSVTSSFTKTSTNTLYVFRTLNQSFTTAFYYFFSSSLSLVQNTFALNGSFFTGSAISVNKTGTALSVATNLGLYLVIPVTSGNTIIDGTNTVYLNTNGPAKNALHLACSNLFPTEGFFIDTRKSVYNYYMSSGTLTISSSLSINYYLLSNLITDGSLEKLYLISNSNDIYTGSTTFNGSSTTITITLYSSSYKYTYTHLKIYNMNNFIFSSNNALIYSINSLLNSYSDSTNNFLWCAISDMNSNNITLTACNTNYIYYLNETICFLKNTKITILENNTEIEKSVELLKKGDLVKTNPNEYHKINFIGTQKLNLTTDLDKIRVLPKNSIQENLPYENLYLTSGHSLLFKDLKNVNEFYNKDVYDNNIEDYYKIMTQHCKLCNKIILEEVNDLIENNQLFVYHFSLESENPSSQYAVYSNGVRSECMSYEYAINKSNMRFHNI